MLVKNKFGSNATASHTHTRTPIQLKLLIQIHIPNLEKFWHFPLQFWSIPFAFPLLIFLHYLERAECFFLFSFLTSLDGTSHSFYSIAISPHFFLPHLHAENPLTAFPACVSSRAGPAGAQHFQRLSTQPTALGLTLFRMPQWFGVPSDVLPFFHWFFLSFSIYFSLQYHLKVGIFYFEYLLAPLSCRVVATATMNDWRLASAPTFGARW